MSTDPEQIRREIEQTRNNLSHDVDAVAYKVSPSRIVDDRKQRAQGAVRKVRDRVMGTASDLGDVTGSAASSLSHRASSTAHRASSAASTVGEAAHQTPAKLREKSEGNPLAAGLIAFGVGWLSSSLLPATSREQRVATQVRAKAGEHTGAVKEKLAEVAHEAKEELREPAQQATESVRATAGEAVQAVRDDSRSAAHEVRDHAREQVRS
ncbi:DUF3618 domain-containing protein [Micromonospora sp. CPCC 206060]|uniref:DUF3618 domain-containing protein n=1 Tax=Micromonospora sp. CPCC 206060 TaxID=3122406 RepID=UPI002FEFECFC